MNPPNRDFLFSEDAMLTIAQQLGDADSSAAHLHRLVNVTRRAALRDYAADIGDTIRACHQMLESALLRHLDDLGWDTASMTRPPQTLACPGELEGSA